MQEKLSPAARVRDEIAADQAEARGIAAFAGVFENLIENSTTATMSAGQADRLGKMEIREIIWATDEDLEALKARAERMQLARRHTPSSRIRLA